MFQSIRVNFVSDAREGRHFCEAQFFSMGRICVGWIRRSETWNLAEDRMCMRMWRAEYLLISPLLSKSLQCLSNSLDIRYLTVNILL